MPGQRPYNGLMNSAHIIRIGNFAAIEQMDGLWLVQNLTTGTKTRTYPKARALRILKGATC